MRNIANSGYLTEEKAAQLKKAQQTTFSKSNYKFLQEHNGLRPGCLHVVMGTTGSGKTTVTRALIAEYLKLNPETVYNWLSEESVDEFNQGLMPYDLSNDQKSQCLIESELDHLPNSADEFLEAAEMTGAKLLVIDNLTTSQFYMDRRIQEQSNLITKIKGWAMRTNTAVLVVVHTRKDVVDNMGRMITENDVRGCASIVNMAHFFYVMQRFQVRDAYYQTLRIAKARGFHLNKQLFVLNYDPETIGYFGDRAIDFEGFKKIFKERNKL